MTRPWTWFSLDDWSTPGKAYMQRLYDRRLLKQQALLFAPVLFCQCCVSAGEIGQNFLFRSELSRLLSLGLLFSAMLAVCRRQQ